MDGKYWAVREYLFGLIKIYDRVRVVQIGKKQLFAVKA